MKSNPNSPTVTGGSRVWKGVVLENVEDKKRRSRVGEGSSNITVKLKYIIIILIYSFTDKLHCLINTATALLELLTALLEYLNHL